MASLANGDFRIVHREYIADMLAEASTPSAFTAAGFPINPGMSNTFPWLSQIAPRFEKYRFNKLKFDYETEASTALGGSVMLAIDYDASDPAPATKVQLMSYKNAVRSAPYQPSSNVSAKLDLGQQKAYFVRSGANPAGTDIKMYDVGNLFACSQGISTGSAVLGELYVEYDVHLMTPQLTSPDDNTIDSSKLTSGNSTSAAQPFGSSGTIVNSLSNPMFSFNYGTSTLTFLRAGSFLASLICNTGTVITAVSTTGTWAGAANFNDYVDSGGLFAASETNTGYQANIGDTLIITYTATTIVSTVLLITECAPI
jgi:hypothetical protein